jgi:hypothetical protein
VRAPLCNASGLTSGVDTAMQLDTLCLRPRRSPSAVGPHSVGDERRYG